MHVGLGRPAVSGGRVMSSTFRKGAMDGILRSGKEHFSADLGTLTPRSLSNYFCLRLLQPISQGYLSWDTGDQAPSSSTPEFSTLMLQVKVCSEAGLSAHLLFFFFTQF